MPILRTLIIIVDTGFSVIDTYDNISGNMRHSESKYGSYSGLSSDNIINEHAKVVIAATCIKSVFTYKTTSWYIFNMI